MDHPLENLGPERFQQLCQALLVSEFPGVTCFPVGMPDGGRDATTRVDSESLIVFQVKFAKAPDADSREWVLNVADGELEKVERLKTRGATTYVLITNVGGTSHLDVGSMDKLRNELSKRLDIDVQCWWRDDINRRLDANWSVKLRYPEVLSGQDFLRLLIEVKKDSSHQRRLNAVRSFMADQFIEDQEVKFKQVELQNRLLDLFVDLPFDIEVGGALDANRRRDLAALKRGLQVVGDGALYQTHDQGEEDGVGTATALLLQAGSELTSQIVVEGAPGQGKSTLAQYICQVHRIRVLNKADELCNLPDHHRHSPVCLPIKVDLRDVSEWLSGVDPFGSAGSQSQNIADKSVEAFLARLIQNKGGGIKFTVNDLIEIAGLSPLFIAFDGLDEVADIKRRADVVSSVTKSLHRLRENCPGLRVMITSRPAAFANSPGFDRKAFPHLQLGSVKRDQINSYAKKWMDARGLTSRERAEFEAILKQKLDQPHLRDLSRNPMQLTILLSLIHTKGAALPDKRTSLYDSYVDLFFSRESTKNPVVRQHLDLLKDIHRYLAWVLHSRAEAGRGTGTDGRFASTELKEVLRAYLERERQDTTIIEEVFSAMLERVVMIVSRIEGTHEFEVQPLREYFAARYLYDTAPYSPPGKERTGTKPDRFDAIAKNHYWLNVVRFFCGCFSKGELLDLADRVKDLINDSNVGKTRHPILLSAMLLSDSVFAQSPRASAELLDTILTRPGLRRLIPVNSRYGREESARISSAGSKLLKEAYKYLNDVDTRSDVQHSIVRLIHANCSAEMIDEVWRESKPDANDDAFERWLKIGSQLGALSRLSNSEARGILRDRVLSSSTIAAIWHSGQAQNAGSNERNAHLVELHVLSPMNYWSDADTCTAPFFLIPIFHQLIANEFFFPDANELQNLAQQALTQFREISQNEINFPKDFLGPLSKKCYAASFEFSSKVATQSELDFLDFWRTAIDCCEEAFGVCPLIVAMTMSLPIAASRKRGASTVSLFDDQISVFRRLTNAKQYARRWSYWRQCLDTLSSTEDRVLFCQAFFLLAPTGMAAEHMEELSEPVDSLSTTQWEELLSFIVSVNPMAGFSPSGRNPEKIPATPKSARLAFLLARQYPASYAKQVFLTHFRDMNSHHPMISQFRQGNAIGCAAAGEISWNEAIEIAKTSYKGSAYFPIDSAVRFPSEIIEEIIKNPDSYPSVLWERVQLDFSARVTRQIKPVAQTAKKEGWFS